MGWLGDLWNGVMDLFGVGTAATQTAMNYDINQKNYDLQKEAFGLQKDAFQFQKDSYLNNFNYQKQLQQQLFNREDNAIQRRAEDMQKAGLSKTLAAGSGAGAGSVVSTAGSNASFNGSAPQRSQVDLISAALQLSQAQAQIRKTNAEAENLIKDSKKKDSDILFVDAQTAYTKARTAVEERNYEMLDLTEEQIKLSNEKTRKEMAKIDVELKSLEQGYNIKEWEFANLYPLDLQLKIQQVANLRKEGRYKDASIIYKDIQSDILTQQLMIAEFEAKIKALDYEYQSITGMKPDSNNNWIVQFVSSLLGSDTADTLIEALVPGYKSGSKPEHSNDTKGKYHDKTPR
ncbi:VP2 [Chicken proventriculitis-associated circular virus 11]|nr:VP2 [Chicken proventriculitis-associated circular virus 11]